MQNGNAVMTRKRELDKEWQNYYEHDSIKLDIPVFNVMSL